MSMVKKQRKLKESDRHLIVSLLSTFGIAFALFGRQLLRELLSTKPSISLNDVSQQVPCPQKVYQFLS